ncbi:MAG: hypothetical protein COB84_09650 [Rhodobacteraceae bacterium]|nr:MAG: hypothetical protein COB84_09650 [Paracoccaceae bacterium]
MNGKIIITAMLTFAVVAGIGLWYSIERAYYTRVSGVTHVIAYGDSFAVSNYTGIDADTSPLKMRACFDVDWDYIPTTQYKDEATPLRAPRFFKCFDAGQMTQDLARDKATAILANENTPYGFNTYIAQYPDGKAYMWRQINACGEAKFSGDDLPEGCPAPSSVDEPQETTSAPKYSDTATVIALLPYGATSVEPVVVDPQKSVQSDANPLSFQACFKTDMSFGFLTETYQTHAAPKPQAQSLSCFDAAQIQADLDQGTALAFIGDTITPSVERVIAIYNDGRGFAWHQKTK